jgi:hypothetical protein
MISTNTNIKLLNITMILIILLLTYVGVEGYKYYQKFNGVIQRVEEFEKRIPKVPKLPNIFKDDLSTPVDSSMSEAGPEIIKETEYILIENGVTEKDEYSDLIDPDRIPTNGPMWTFSGSDLVGHLEVQHEVQKHQVFNWTDSQLVRLHAYLHNGGKLEDLPRK